MLLHRWEGREGGEEHGGDEGLCKCMGVGKSHQNNNVCFLCQLDVGQLCISLGFQVLNFKLRALPSGGGQYSYLFGRDEYLPTRY